MNVKMGNSSGSVSCAISVRGGWYVKTIDAGRARLVRSGAAHVFAALKPFEGDSVGGAFCGLLSLVRLLEFEFE